MAQRYGILAGLAIALMVADVHAAEVGSTNVRTATVRLASVTTVADANVVGLSGATKQVEDYFNDLTTLQANFKQTVTGEAKPSTGTFYLSRPGKFLWQYEAPVRQRIISTGSAAYYVDQERNQVTQLPMDAGVARLFNAKILNLSKQGLRATHVQTMASQLSVDFAVDKKIATSDQAGLVNLKLTFDRLGNGRLQLRQIDALDTLSVTTRVEFSSMRENVNLPTKLFDFTPGVYDQRN